MSCIVCTKSGLTMELNSELEADWQKVVGKITDLTNKKPKDINTVLFLIGVRELGHGVKSYSKEEKQDLIHIALCRLLSQEGYYQLEGLDEEGWPHWKLIKEVPYHNVTEQVVLMKSLIIDYFFHEQLI